MESAKWVSEPVNGASSANIASDRVWLWLSPILPQLRLGKKIYHAKFWASEVAGTLVRVRSKFVLNWYWNPHFYYANFVSAIDFYGNFMVTLTKVPPIPEAWKFAWDIFLPSLVYGKIGESQCLTLGRFHWRNGHHMEVAPLCEKSNGFVLHVILMSHLLVYFFTFFPARP